MDSTHAVTERRSLRPARELDDAETLTEDERAVLEQKREEYFRHAQSRAARARIPLNVTPDSSIRDLESFILDAIAADARNVEYLEKKECSLTDDERRERHEAFPVAFSQVTAAEIREEHDKGARGKEAIDQALMRKVRDLETTTASTATAMREGTLPTASRSERRPRERSRRATVRRSARAPDDEGEPPPARAGSRYTLTCSVCGEPFGSSRPHAKTCTLRCRKRAHKGRRSAASIVAVAIASESLVVDEVRGGRLSPEDAILWLTDPEGCRARVGAVPA